MANRTKQNLLTLGGLALTTALSTFSFQAHADNPWGDLTGTGFTTNTTDVKNTIIDTNVMVAVGSGSNINILSDESVRVNMTDNNHIFVASRVADNNLPTLIDGGLSSNGKIIIQDTNGILYGENSRIDVNGLVSTTAGSVDVSEDGTSVDLDSFDNGDAEIVILRGADITIQEGGLAAFVSPTVVNRGVITAKTAKVELAGSNTKTTVDLFGDSLVEIALDKENEAALLSQNYGRIQTDGGTIHMTTGAAKNIVDSVVNLKGVARADSVTQVAGKIILGGANTGEVKMTGKAQARGKTGGGDINIAAKDISTSRFTEINSRAEGTGNAANINIQASNNLNLMGVLSAEGGRVSGNAGVITTSATNVLSMASDLKVKATAASGNVGSWTIDPIDFTVDAGVANVFNTTLNTGVSISASAANDVMVDAALAWTGGAALTLNAGNDLLINNTMNGDGIVSLVAGNLVDVNSVITASAIDFDAPTVSLAADLISSNLSGNATIVNVENNMAKIQDGIDIAANNARVNIARGTYNENISIDKGIEIFGISRDATIIDASGGQDGFNVSTDLGTNNVTIEKLAVINAQRDGVHVARTANLNNLRLSAVWLKNNGLRGSAVFGDSVKGRTQIVNSLFNDNGFSSTANGDGDILFYHHNGNISLGNVTVNGNTGGLADYGVQIIGNPTKAAAGTIVLNNLKVAGQYRVANLGIQQYDDLGSLSFNNVKLGGQTTTGNNSVSTAGWGGALFLSNLGATDIDLKNTEFKANDSNYIVLGAYNGNTEFTSTNIDATNSTFLGKLGSDMTLAENFAVEDKVGHKMDFAPFGLVTWENNNVFATQASETGFAGVIQRGVDASNTGGNIWVQNGTFVGDVNANQSVNLYGAQAGVDARNRTSVDETIVLMQSPGFTVTADNVTIDGFEITDGDSGDAGVIVDGADNVTLANNKIHDIRRGVNGDGIWIQSSKDGVVTQNWIYDINDDGLNARGFSTGLNVNNNLIENVRSSGLEAYRLLGTVGFSDNVINNAGRDGIRMHRADNSTVANNVITMNNIGEGIILSNINNVNVAGNAVNNALYGITVDAGTGNTIDGNGVNGFGEGVGVLLKNTTNSTTKDNTLDGFKNGVQLDGTTSLAQITNNIVTNNTDTNSGRNSSDYSTGIGIYVAQNTSDIMVQDNTINGNTDGIRVMGAGNDIVVNGNSVENSADKGIIIKQTNGATVNDNELDGNRQGIRINIADNTIVTNNIIDNSTDEAIHIDRGSDNTQAIDNEITVAKNGIWVQGGQNNLIDDNDIKAFTQNGVRVTNNANGTKVTDNLIQSTENNAIGVNVDNSQNTIVGGIGNTLRNRIFDIQTGVKITSGTNTDVVGNDIRRSEYGVLASNAGALDINNNKIDDTAFGIDMFNSDDATVVDNVITDSVIGIFVEEGENVLIDDNDIKRFDDAAIVLERTIDAAITDNLIQDGFIGVDLIDTVGTQIGGDGNTLRNRIYDVSKGVQLSGDTNTTIDGNDFRRNGVAITGDFDPSYTTTDLVVTDNTIDDSNMAMMIYNAPNAQIGGADDANIITNSGGIQVSNSDGASVENNELATISGTGINMIETDNVSVSGNTLTNITGSGILALRANSNTILNNTITDVGQNGISVQNTINANIVDNTISGATSGAGILVDGSTGTVVINNQISDGNVGVEVRGFTNNEFTQIIPTDDEEGEGAFSERPQQLIAFDAGSESDDTLILGNTITNNNVGIKTSGNGVNLVQVQSNDLDTNAVGMLLEGGEIDISNLLLANTINGGETSMIFDGADVSLVNDSLGSTIFTDQTGNYITLQNGALFNPGTPTVIDGLAANWNGVIPLNSPLGAGIITGDQRTAIEALIQDFNDDGTLGDILVGLGFDVSEEDLFALGLFSFSPAASNVNVTFRGLPPTTAPDIAALANIAPAAGDGDTTAAELASLEPASGGNEGCWAAVGDTGFDGTVNFSFGGGIDSVIGDSACAQ